MQRKVVVSGILAIVLLAAASFFYFFFLRSSDRQALAQVNGEPITIKQFNGELSKVEDPLRQIYQEEPQQFLEEIIVKRLLIQEAKRVGITPPVKTYKDVGKDSLPPDDALITELMKKKFSAPPTVTKEEIKAFYSMFKPQMGETSLEKVSPAIENLIREGKQQEQVRGFVEELRTKAKIEIDQIRLRKIAAKPPELNTEDDFKKALSAGKPALVNFGANNCLPCRQLRPVLKEISKEHGDKASVLVIDVYKYQELAKQYKIMAIPTLVFFGSQGKEVFRQVGVMDKEQIVAKLKEIGMGT